MKTMVRIEFYRTGWDGNNTKFFLDEGDKPSSCLIDVDAIQAIDDVPTTNEVYNHDSRYSSDKHVPTKMYFVRTSIGVGRGINGVDFKSFWVTEDTYKKLLTMVEVI